MKQLIKRFSAANAFIIAFFLIWQWSQSAEMRLNTVFQKAAESTVSSACNYHFSEFNANAYGSITESREQSSNFVKITNSCFALSTIAAEINPYEAPPCISDRFRLLLSLEKWDIIYPFHSFL